MHATRYSEVECEKAERGHSTLMDKYNVPLLRPCGIGAGRYTVMFPNPFDDLPGDQTSAAYNGQIFLDPEDWNNWDVIIHEYGHLVAGDAGFFNITGNPFY